MNVIYKYPIQNSFSLQLPVGAKVLCVQMQYNVPYMWVMQDTSNYLEPRHFRIVNTGDDTDCKPENYIGTFQEDNGSYVGHLFEYT